MNKHITRTELKAKMSRMNLQSALQSAGEAATKLLDDMLSGSLYEGGKLDAQDLEFAALALVDAVADYRSSCEPMRESEIEKPEGPSQAERL